MYRASSFYKTEAYERYFYVALSAQSVVKNVLTIVRVPTLKRSSFKKIFRYCKKRKKETLSLVIRPGIEGFPPVPVLKRINFATFRLNWLVEINQ